MHVQLDIDTLYSGGDTEFSFILIRMFDFFCQKKLN